MNRPLPIFSGRSSSVRWFRGMVLVVGMASLAACHRPNEPQAKGPADVASRPATCPAAKALTFPVGRWVSLFDGSSLRGWRILDDGYYMSHGDVFVKDGAMRLEPGQELTGVAWSGPFPCDNYEVALEAARVSGYDFFCGMTFPVGHERCTLIVGGWGGTVVGLSNVDGQHAADNETTQGISFERGRWYRIRLRVTTPRIEVWLDDEKIIDLAREGHHFDVWDEQDAVRPFGFATWETGGALRNIRVRRLAE